MISPGLNDDDLTPEGGWTTHTRLGPIGISPPMESWQNELGPTVIPQSFLFIVLCINVSMATGKIRSLPGERHRGVTIWQCYPFV